MSEKIIERKIIHVSRTLPEFIVKHVFLFPEVCTFKIKIRSLPEDGAALAFHLISARTVSPLCSVKGLNKTNSIQDFPKLPTTKEKSECSVPAQRQQLQGAHPMPFLAPPAWPQRGHGCTKSRLIPRGDAVFSMLK